MKPHPCSRMKMMGSSSPMNYSGKIHLPRRYCGTGPGSGDGDSIRAIPEPQRNPAGGPTDGQRRGSRLPRGSGAAQRRGGPVDPGNGGDLGHGQDPHHSTNYAETFSAVKPPTTLPAHQRLSSQGDHGRAGQIGIRFRFQKLLLFTGMRTPGVSAGCPGVPGERPDIGQYPNHRRGNRLRGLTQLEFQSLWHVPYTCSCCLNPI